MLELVEYVLSILVEFVIYLKNLVILEFRGANITLLGFIGALVIVSVMIRVFMPKP